MAATVMDGKALAAKVKEEIRQQVEQMEQKPGLAVILVGNDEAAKVYAKGKKRDCHQCGIYSEEYILPLETTQQELLELIDALNGREDIDAILVEMPLPPHLDEDELLLAVRPDKDVDCFHPINVGRLMMGEESCQPCTPAGILRMLQEYGIVPKGKHCVIVGRSNIVGKPLAMLMVREDATVTICHTNTKNLKAECLRGDIVVVSAGQAGLLTGDMIQEGAVVIDVAVNRDVNGGLCGDVVYSEVAQKASFITPVPGGVGPMTRSMLMANTLYAARKHGKK